MKSISRTILIGLLTAAPLIITWLIVSFLFDWLSSIGRPWVRGLAFGIRPQYPALADLMLNEVLQSVAAVLVVLALLFLLGWATGQVLGQRLIRFAERAIGAIPVVDSIYRATKRFLAVASATPGGEKRVVLIEFPTSGMKTLGLVTKVLRDQTTGEELAAVYIPTAPNPTSGYVEILPVTSLVFLDWTFDQAMSFIVTGGSNGPDTMNFSGQAPAQPRPLAPARRHTDPDRQPGADDDAVAVAESDNGPDVGSEASASPPAGPIR